MADKILRHLPVVATIPVLSFAALAILAAQSAPIVSGLLGAMSCFLFVPYFVGYWKEQVGNRASRRRLQKQARKEQARPRR